MKTLQIHQLQKLYVISECCTEDSHRVIPHRESRQYAGFLPVCHQAPHHASYILLPDRGFQSYQVIESSTIEYLASLHHISGGPSQQVHAISTTHLCIAT